MKFIANIILIIFLMFLNLKANSQKLNDVESVYKSLNFNNYESNVKTIFKWVSLNLKYDVDKYEIVKNKKTEKLKSKILIANNTINKKKGICEDYANLFSLLLDKANIENILVSGYVKNIEGIVENELSHLWVIAKVNNTWKIYDPTWASGFINLNTGKFVEKYDEKWFETNPNSMIKTHFPYNPIFQLLNNPIPSKYFDNALYYDGSLTKINFNSEIDYYKNLSEIEQLKFTKQKILTSNSINQLQQDYLNYINKNIEVYTFNLKVDEKNKQININNKKINEMNLIVEDLNKLQKYFINNVNKFAGKIILPKRKKQLKSICKTSFEKAKALSKELNNLQTNDKRFQKILSDNKMVVENFLKKIKKYEMQL